MRQYLLATVILFSVFSLWTGVTIALSETNPFWRNLTLGDTGSDVLALQKELNKKPFSKIADFGPGSPGEETLFFGEKTKDAVRRYQEMWRQEILTPAGLSFGTGYFGEMTRKHLTQNSSTTPLPVPPTPTKPISSKPIIISVTPTHAMEGTEVTLTGTGFLATNTVYASFNKLEKIPSPDGKTIKFVVQEPFPDDLEVPDFLREKFKSTQYGFYISNANGASNTVMFTLDLIKQ